jgi:uncharacterized protein
MDQPTEHTQYAAFDGPELLATGNLGQVLPAVKERFDRDAGASILIFEDASGRQVDFDLRGTIREVLARALPPPRTGPGRPRMGVVPREISLLPRHWEWLEQQPNGASAAIRRLVDEARKADPEGERIRSAIAAASRFLSAMAGNLPGYEEATRALFARNRESFEERIQTWPAGIREHARRMTTGCL